MHEASHDTNTTPQNYVPALGLGSLKRNVRPKHGQDSFFIAQIKDWFGIETEKTGEQGLRPTKVCECTEIQTLQPQPRSAHPGRAQSGPGS